MKLMPVESIGMTGGNWCPFNLNIDLPLDQNMDDGRSLCFDTEPLTTDFQVLGAPQLDLAIAVDKPVAYVIARLNEVFPDGRSNRATYAVLNLCQRESNEHPQPLAPGRTYRVHIRYDNVAHTFHRGSRIRVALSTSYFPMVMPSPEPVTLTVFPGISSIELPVRPPWQGDSKVKFAPPFALPVRVKVLKDGTSQRIAEYDVASRRMVTRYHDGGGISLLEATETQLSGGIQTTFTIDDKDPAGTVVDHRAMNELKRGEFAPRFEARVKFTATKTHYLVNGELTAYDGDEKMFARVWDEKIPRKLC